MFPERTLPVEERDADLFLTVLLDGALLTSDQEDKLMLKLAGAAFQKTGRQTLH